MNHRYRIDISYLGTPFKGWQLQKNGITVQGEIERALGEMVGLGRVVVVATARTDTGVHARGQIAHFDLPVEIGPPALLKSLNRRLPDSIRILLVRPVPSSFHAQKVARAKLYSYRIRWLDCPPAPPWQVLRSALLRRPGNLEDLRTALAQLAGVHDWASFSVKYPHPMRTRRQVFSTAVIEGPHGLRLDFKGEGFLRYQIRRMVGALLQVASGEHDLGWFDDLLAQPTPGSAVFNAPARGLTLEKIYLRTPAAVTLRTDFAMVHSAGSGKD